MSRPMEAGLPYLPPALQGSQGTIYESSSIRGPPRSLSLSPPSSSSLPILAEPSAALPPSVPLDRSAAPGREFRDASLNCAAKKFAHRLGRQPRSLLEREEENVKGDAGGVKERRGVLFSPSSPLFPRFKDGSLLPPRALPLPRMDSARRWLLDSRPIAATYSYRTSYHHPLVAIRLFGCFTAILLILKFTLPSLAQVK